MHLLRVKARAVAVLVLHAPAAGFNAPTAILIASVAALRSPVAASSVDSR